MELSYAQQQQIGLRYVLDALEPVSPYGAEQKRLLEAASPTQRTSLEQSLLRTQAAVQHPASNALLRALMGFFEVRGSLKAVETRTATDVDFFEWKRFLLQLGTLSKACDAYQDREVLCGLCLSALSEPLALLDPDKTGTPAFSISSTGNPRLFALRQQKRTMDPRDAGWTQLVAQEAAEEERVRQSLAQALAPWCDAVRTRCDAIGTLDLTFAKAALARRFGGTFPTLTAHTLAMEEGKNPMLADAWARNGVPFTPVSIAPKMGSTVITGANMGGKSVAIKTLALNVLLVHLGLFPIARAFATPLFSHLLLSDTQEDGRQGLSSFGKEIQALNEAAAFAADGLTLALFDEPARSTNPEEGKQLVCGAVRWFDRQNAMALFATHYDGVSRYASRHYRIMGLQDGAQDDADALTDRIDHRLCLVDPNAPVPRDAIRIAALLGLNGDILDEVYQIKER